MTRFWARLFGARAAPPMDALYAAIVARGRAPHWYVAGAVPDTVDGRFDMIVAILSLVLIRLEDGGCAAEAVALTEAFIADMDGQLRQQGVGDMGVGKRMGRLVSALGGRLGAYRAARGAGELASALVRNLYRGADPGAPALAHVAAALEGFAEALGALPAKALIAGELP